MADNIVDNIAIGIADTIENSEYQINSLMGYLGDILPLLITSCGCGLRFEYTHDAYINQSTFRSTYDNLSWPSILPSLRAESSRHSRYHASLSSNIFNIGVSTTNMERSYSRELTLKAAYHDIDSNDDIITSLNSIYTVTSKDTGVVYVACVLTTTGKLIVYRDTFPLLFRKTYLIIADYIDDVCAGNVDFDKSVLHGYCESFVRHIKSVFDVALSIITQKMNANSVNSIQTGDIYADLVTNIGERLHRQLVISSSSDGVGKIKAMIKDEIMRYFSTDRISFLHMLNMSTFRNVVVQLIRSNEQSAKKHRQEGYRIGFRGAMGLLRAGFDMQNENEIRKKVNIVPTQFIRRGILYDMHVDDRPYAIRSLSVDFDYERFRLEIECQGRHPNVSSNGIVCVGDENQRMIDKLVGDVDDFDIDKFIEVIQTIEETLKIVNFDSSYSQQSEEFYNRAMKASDIVSGIDNSEISGDISGDSILSF